MPRLEKRTPFADNYPEAYEKIIGFLFETRKLHKPLSIKDDFARKMRKHLFDVYYMFNRKRRKLMQRFK